MSIKLVFTKAGCSIGEVVLTDCDNIKSVVPDLAMAVYCIRDGYGYDVDQVEQEWINISNNFIQLLEVHKNDGLKYWSIELLSLDGFINVTFN